MLYKCKNVEMFGSGFKKVYELCESADVKVSYDLDNFGFSFIFERKSDKNKPYTSISNKNNLLNATNKEVVDAIREEPTLSSNEISKKLDSSTRTVQRSLSSLKEIGKIKRIGTIRRGYWKIIN